MGIIETLLYIVVIIAAVLLILLTLVQSNKGSDLGLFGGSTEMVFGSQKGNILTRITAVLAVIVLAGAFLMSVIRVYLMKEAKDIQLLEQKQQIKTLDELKQQANPQTDTKPVVNKQPVEQNQAKQPLQQQKPQTQPDKGQKGNK